MAKLTVRITHVSWRDGRPRFEPGPKLRAEGWTGEDLRHGPEVTRRDGRREKQGEWFTPAEALAFMDKREAEIEARRAEVAKARKAKVRIPAHAAPRTAIGITVANLFAAFLEHNPKFQGEQVKGKRRQKAASPATVAFYRQQDRTLEKFDAEIWTAPVEALSGPILYDLHQRLWEESGLSSARAVLAGLSAAISWGMRTGRVKLATNPAKGLQLEVPEARLRCLTPPEVRQLIAAADLTGRHGIGDAIVLGVWTGQRQADRLSLTDAGRDDAGRRVFRQAKTKAIVALREAPELAARLAAIRTRRQGWSVQPVELVADDGTRRPYLRSHYAHQFARVRKAAVAGIRDETGGWLLPPMPSLTDARDQDLRDTAVTWLARAGSTVPEIAQVTGHSIQSVQQTLKHYLASHPELSDNAIRKAVAWYEGQD